jgi:hypothetical protein
VSRRRRQQGDTELGGTDSVAIPSRKGSEADLEKRLAGANPAERARLMAALGFLQLDRQLPVGVFDGSPARGSEIFTAGKSAIDLVGLDDNRALWLLDPPLRSGVARRIQLIVATRSLLVIGRDRKPASQRRSFRRCFMAQRGQA